MFSNNATVGLFSTVTVSQSGECMFNAVTVSLLNTATVSQESACLILSLSVC